MHTYIMNQLIVSLNSIIVEIEPHDLMYLNSELLSMVKAIIADYSMSFYSSLHSFYRLNNALNFDPRICYECNGLFLLASFTS